jgi:hypothetical protein
MNAKNYHRFFYKITIKYLNKIAEKKKKNDDPRALFMRMNSDWNAVVQANTISF